MIHFIEPSLQKMIALTTIGGAIITEFGIGLHRILADAPLPTENWGHLTVVGCITVALGWMTKLRNDEKKEHSEAMDKIIAKMEEKDKQSLLFRETTIAQTTDALKRMGDAIEKWNVFSDNFINKLIRRVIDEDQEKTDQDGVKKH